MRYHIRSALIRALAIVDPDVRITDEETVQAWQSHVDHAIGLIDTIRSTLGIKQGPIIDELKRLKGLDQ